MGCALSEIEHPIRLNMVDPQLRAITARSTV